MDTGEIESASAPARLHPLATRYDANGAPQDRQDPTLQITDSPRGDHYRLARHRQGHDRGQSRILTSL